MNFFKRYKTLLPLLIWAVAYGSMLFYYKHEYLSRRFIFFLGLALAPFILRRISLQRSWRFSWWALAFGSILFFERGNMPYYFCAGFGLLFLLETGWGRLNNLPGFLLVFVSPVFQYIADVWSFPLRLKMSELAGAALAALGYTTEVAGNVIILDGVEFSVDPACMGLNILSTSLLLGLLLMSYFERKHNYVFSIPEISLWMLLALALSVFSNFNRLLALVLFHVLPDNPAHDIWGLFGLMVYVIAPLHFLLKWRLRRVNRPQEIVTYQNHLFSGWPTFALRLSIFLLLIFFGKAPDHQPVFISAMQNINLPGFESSLTENGILKLESDSALVYVKPPSGALRANHDPRICWKGSGYEFNRIQKERLGGCKFYSAVLNGHNTKLYSAWWYDNGIDQTIEELDWRWANLLGVSGGYYLINVTCEDRIALERLVPEIRNKLKVLIL